MKTPEEIKRRKHEYYLKNKDKWNKSKEKNFDREKAIEYAKTYYENNKNKWKEYNKIDSSEKLSNRLEVVKEAYESYWKYIRCTISELPLKDDLSEEEFNKLRVNFNIPSLGKLAVTWDRYKAIKSRYKYALKLRNENSRRNKEKKA